MRLNAAVAAGGGIRAAVLNSAGEALAGMSLDDCESIGGDGADLPLRWRGATIESLGAQPFRLLLELRAATAYAIAGCARAGGRG